jgi:hypothetical protein
LYIGIIGIISMVGIVFIIYYNKHKQWNFDQNNNKIIK